MLDLNAVLRVMPQKVSLQVENNNNVSRVKLAAGCTEGGKGQVDKKVQVQAGANLPLCKGAGRVCTCTPVLRQVLASLGKGSFYV